MGMLKLVCRIAIRIAFYLIVFILGFVQFLIIILWLYIQIDSRPRTVDLDDTGMQIYYHNNLVSPSSELRLINKSDHNTATFRFESGMYITPVFYDKAGCDTIYILNKARRIKKIDSGNYHLEFFDTSNFDAIHRTNAIIDSLLSTGQYYEIYGDSPTVPYIVNPDGKVLSKDRFLITH